MKRCNNCFEEYNENLDMCPLCGYEIGDDPEEVYFLKPSTILHNRYIIGYALGFGGFGITYKAWDINLNTAVAIKEYFYASLATRDENTQDVIVNSEKKIEEFMHFKDAFLDEARCTAKFNKSSNIVNVYEYFEEHQTAYMVMEFLVGSPLNSIMKKENLSVESALDYTNQVISALKDVHKENIIHRDISPDNIFVLNGGKVKLIDFGAARSAFSETELTQILKPGFAPQEQYRSDDKQGPWTDIYALGATTYYMLTGVKPVESTNRISINEDPLESPKALNPEISENINNTILRAMSIEIHLRFQNLDEFENALNGKVIVRDVVGERKRRKFRRTLGLSIASFCLLIGVFCIVNMFINNIENETLPTCSIEIWYELPADEDLASSKINSFEQITNTFTSSYSNVEINIVYYESGTYEQAIENAYSTGDMPNLFESSYISEEITESSMSTKNAISQLSSTEKTFLTSYNDYTKFPTGFIISIKYKNTTFEQEDSSEAFENSQSNFLEELIEEYEGTSADYMDIQTTLPARFTMEQVNTDEIVAQYTDLWSVSSCDDDQYKVASKFLSFLISDYAQDYLHIQYHSDSFPLNTQTLLDSYVFTFDDFSEFFENFKIIVFEK
ncbi:MAG: serine/threonine-protein kinase [Clostridia bacterium]